MKAVAGEKDERRPASVVLNPWRLEPVDLRRFIRLGVEHILQGAIDRRRGCLPFVRFNLTESPTYASHSFWGSPHMVGRFLDALACASRVIEIPKDELAFEGLRRRLHDSLNNAHGLPYHEAPGPDGETAMMHNCREVLLGLVALHTWRGCEKSATLAKRMVRTIDGATRKTGSFPSSTLIKNEWVSGEKGHYHDTTGRLIRALIVYYRATRDELAVELATRFAKVNIAQTLTPEGELNDAAGTHLHSSEGTMTSLIDLGILTGEPQYLQTGKKLYDVALSRWRTSFGWAKETRSMDAGRGETNNTGDYVEAALLLGRQFGSDYTRQAERFIRNGLLASQVVATEWIVQSREADTEELCYSDLRRRARGAFAFTTPNGYHSYNTDLMGGAIQSLVEACEATVSAAGAEVSLNMLFSTDSPWLSVRSQLPQAGCLDIVMRRPADLAVRLAPSIGEKEVELTVGGQRRAATWNAGTLRIRGLLGNESITVRFPLLARQDEESVPGVSQPYRIEWRGDTIVRMEPREGKIALYPS